MARAGLRQVRNFNKMPARQGAYPVGCPSAPDGRALGVPAVQPHGHGVHQPVFRPHALAGKVGHDDLVAILRCVQAFLPAPPHSPRRCPNLLLPVLEDSRRHLPRCAPPPRILGTPAQQLQVPVPITLRGTCMYAARVLSQSQAHRRLHTRTHKPIHTIHARKPTHTGP
jgi:hypothetical protein